MKTGMQYRLQAGDGDHGAVKDSKEEPEGFEIVLETVGKKEAELAVACS